MHALNIKIEILRVQFCELCFVNIKNAHFCGMGFVASSNYGSQPALQACYFQACKNNGNDHVRFQTKVGRKRAKSYRPLKIPYQPLGTLDKAFQVDSIKTLKDRLIDTILLKE